MRWANKLFDNLDFPSQCERDFLLSRLKCTVQRERQKAGSECGAEGETCRGVKDGARNARCMKSQRGTTWERVERPVSFFFFFIVFVILTCSVFIVGRAGGVFLKMHFLSQKDSSPLPFKKIFK